METWKDVEGFEGYMVSSEGRVLSTKREEPRMLKPDLTCRVDGKNVTYYRVTLCRDGKTKRFALHRLVASIFIPNPENKPQVNHINGDRSCNEVSNLEWCTASENIVHAFNTGLKGRGEKMYGAKKTDKQVSEVCQMIQDKVPRCKILKECGFLSLSSYKDIQSKRRWTHVSKDYTW